MRRVGDDNIYQLNLVYRNNGVDESFHELLSSDGLFIYEKADKVDLNNAVSRISVNETNISSANNAITTLRNRINGIQGLHFSNNSQSSSYDPELCVVNISFETNNGGILALLHIRDYETEIITFLSIGLTTLEVGGGLQDRWINKSHITPASVFNEWIESIQATKQASSGNIPQYRLKIKFKNSYMPAGDLFFLAGQFENAVVQYAKS